MPHEVIMPALGMAQDTGLIVSWLKQPGDAVKIGDALMEVETDKAVMEVEAQADGFLTGVAAAAGDNVPVGNVVAVIAETADAIEPAFIAKDEKIVPNAETARRTDAQQDVLPAGVEIIMPALGMAQDTGLIVAWRKEPGDAVGAGDILLEVETDKSVMEVEAGHNGYVAAILADAQQAVPVGTVIAVITTDKPEKAISRTHAAITAPANTEPQADTAKASKANSDEIRQPLKSGTSPLPGGRILASPKARQIAMEQGLDLSLLVERGFPQPYHVADLEILKTLGPSSESEESETPAAQSIAIMSISARIPTTGCDDFIAWMADDGGIHLEPYLLWLRFATAALRNATGRDSDTLTVEIRQVHKTDGRFVDADRSRLSKPVPDAGDRPPDLILRDFTGSPVISVSGVVGSAPQLTIGKDRDDYTITLNCHAGQLGEAQAIDLVTGFAERLCEPLRQLV